MLELLHYRRTGARHQLIPARAILGAACRNHHPLAVAVILFEGGLSLNFSRTETGGRRAYHVVFIAGPIAGRWHRAAHYGAGPVLGNIGLARGNH